MSESANRLAVAKLKEQVFRFHNETINNITGGQLPQVTEIFPNTGDIAGGLSVTLTGARFTGATQVMFGATPATSVSVDSDTQITCDSPAESAGFVDVTVVTPAGISPVSTADLFCFQDVPTVTGIEPPSGLTLGGSEVVITGTGLFGATVVVFGGTSALSFVVDSPTQITAVAPAGSSGTVDITVITPISTSATSSADHYDYVTPSGGSPGPFTSVVAKTADYTIISGDTGNVLTFDGAYLGAFLPASVPAEPWQVQLLNLNLSPLTVIPGAVQFNGVGQTSSLALSNAVVLHENESIDIWSDGLNYFYRLVQDRPTVSVAAPKWYYTGFSSNVDVGVNPWAVTTQAVDGASWTTVKNPALVNKNGTWIRDNQHVRSTVDDYYWMTFDEYAAVGGTTTLIGVAHSSDGLKTWQQDADIDLASVFTDVFGSYTAPQPITSTFRWDGAQYWMAAVLLVSGHSAVVAFPVTFGAGTFSLDLTSGHYEVWTGGTINVTGGLPSRDPSTGTWHVWGGGESTSGVITHYTAPALFGPWTAGSDHPISASPEYDGFFAFHIGNGVWRAYTPLVGTAHMNDWPLSYWETTDLSADPWPTGPIACTLDNGSFFCDSLGMRPWGLEGSFYYDRFIAADLAALVSGNSNSDAAGLLLGSLFGG